MRRLTWCSRRSGEEKLRYNHATLKQGLLDLGFEDHVAHSDRQILTIVTGDANTTQSWRRMRGARRLWCGLLPAVCARGQEFCAILGACGADGNRSGTLPRVHA